MTDQEQVHLEPEGTQAEPQAEDQGKANELAALFPIKREVAGYQVKPWTTKQFIQVFPMVSQIAKGLTAKGCTFQDFEAWFTGNLLEVGDIVLPHAIQLITISLRITEQEMDEKLEWPQILEIIGIILVVNLEHLKNFRGQVLPL